MKLAKVVGNVVSTIKEQTHHGYKMMLIKYVDQDGNVSGGSQIALDAANAGIGDFVLINVDGGAAKAILSDKEVIVDITICGVVDHINFNGQIKLKE
jgi:microcompartment protein CcmK/EutM